MSSPEMLSEVIKSGEVARLFSVVSETSKEKRAVSVFLACLKAIPDLNRNLMATIGRKVGSTSKISTFSEIELVNNSESTRDRPDGLIEIKTGKNIWRCLVEAKIGNADIDQEQIVRYADLAKQNKIDSIITISNQFVALPDHHPISLPRSTINHVNLFHWSWQSILTEAQLLYMNDQVQDMDQAFILSEFIRFFGHQSTGVSTFDQMNVEWKEIVRPWTHIGAARFVLPPV